MGFMTLRYLNLQLHPISLLFAAFLAATITSRLNAQEASIATTQPQTVIDATSRGIVGDGATLNTVAIQSAIDSLTAHGGGVLEFPAGRYVTGTIQLKDKVRCGSAAMRSYWEVTIRRIIESLNRSSPATEESWVMRW